MSTPNPNKGKPLPSWLPETWRDVIEKLRDLGYGILPDGTKGDINTDRGWFVVPSDDVDVSLLHGPGWIADSTNTAGESGDDLARLLLFRKGYVEPGVASNSDEDPIAHGDLPMPAQRKKWSCGHRYFRAPRCGVCAAFGILTTA